jgi:hypothetical protein
MSRTAPKADSWSRLNALEQGVTTLRRGGSTPIVSDHVDGAGDIRYQPGEKSKQRIGKKTTGVVTRVRTHKEKP